MSKLAISDLKRLLERCPEYPDIDADFIKSDERLRRVGKLQKLLRRIEDVNFEESLDKIVGLGFSSDVMAYDLARNMIRLSIAHRNKIDLFVRIVSELKTQCSIISQILSLFGFGYHIGSARFFLSLAASGLLSDSSKAYIETKCTKRKYNQLFYQPENLQEVIEEDNVEELKQMLAFPMFKIDRHFTFAALPRFKNERSESRYYLSSIEFAAQCGSIKCFRFLYINGASIEDKTNSLMSSAIIGGNIEIIQILMQANIYLKESNISTAIMYHRVEIFDWYLEQYPESLEKVFAMECFMHEFIHGIKRLKVFNPSRRFYIVCEGGLVSIPMLLLTNFSFVMYEIQSGFQIACRTGNIEIVKLLLSLPSIDVNSISFYLSAVPL